MRPPTPPALSVRSQVSSSRASLCLQRFEPRSTGSSVRNCHRGAAVNGLSHARTLGLGMVAIATLTACAGGKATSAPAATVAPAISTTTSTTAVPVASLSDVFGVALPAGYALAAASTTDRNELRQGLDTAADAAVVRDVDLELITLDGRTIGTVTVFLMQPGQQQQEPAITLGFAQSSPGSRLSAATIGGKSVTFIQWNQRQEVAYSASDSQIVVITEVQTRSELDTVTPALISSIH